MKLSHADRMVAIGIRQGTLRAHDESYRPRKHKPVERVTTEQEQKVINFCLNCTKEVCKNGNCAALTRYTREVYGNG